MDFKKEIARQGKVIDSYGPNSEKAKEHGVDSYFMPKATNYRAKSGWKAQQTNQQLEAKASVMHDFIKLLQE